MLVSVFVSLCHTTLIYFLQLVLVVDTFLVYPLMQITTAKGMYRLAYHCVD